MDIARSFCNFLQNHQLCNFTLFLAFILKIVLSTYVHCFEFCIEFKISGFCRYINSIYKIFTSTTNFVWAPLPFETWPAQGILLLKSIDWICRLTCRKNPRCAPHALFFFRIPKLKALKFNEVTPMVACKNRTIYDEIFFHGIYTPTPFKLEYFKGKSLAHWNRFDSEFSRILEIQVVLEI